MPRKAREKSSTGIYHVVLRGINRQIIFEDDEDYQKLLQTLQEYQETSGYEIFGYCLMSNHIHTICSTGFGLRLFSEDPETAKKLFKAFNLEKNNNQCLEYDQNMRWKDPEAIDYIKKIGNIKSPIEIQNFGKEKRDAIIKICKDKGLSIRQLERLTGISFGVIRKIGE